MTSAERYHLYKEYLPGEMLEAAQECLEWLRIAYFRPCGEYEICSDCGFLQHTERVFDMVKGEAPVRAI
jgi:hypothetical protein